MTKNSYLLGLACAVTAAVIWSSSFIALKIALFSMPPMSIIFFRMLLASGIFIFFYKKIASEKLNNKDIFYIILMIVLEPGLYFVFEIKALEFTSASQAGAIASIMPLLTAIGASLVLKESISKYLIFGSFLAMAGAVWLSLFAVAETNAPNPLLGNSLEFLAMTCAAGYTLTLKYLSKRFSALFLTAIQSFGGVLFFLPLFIFEWQSSGLSVSLDALLALFYLGFVVTLGGYGLFNYALTIAPASKIANTINLMPAFTILLAFIILGESLSYAQLLCVGVIFLGVIISQKK